MPTVTLPTYDVPHRAESVGHAKKWSLWRWYSGIATALVTIITSGVATAFPGLAVPTVDQINDADDSTSTTNGKAAWYSTGSDQSVTLAEAAILQTAGYTVQVFSGWTHEEDTATISPPSEATEGDLLILVLARDSAVQWATISGWTRDFTAQQSVGDNRAVALYSRSYVAGAVTLPATADHAVMLSLPGDATFSDASATDNQSVVADFTSPSVSSSQGDLVLRFFYASQHTSGVTPADETDTQQITSPGPDAADTGSEEIWWHFSASGGSTGTFTWAWSWGGAPEIYSVTAVYA
jgi:hypothetical protein